MLKPVCFASIRSETGPENGRWIVFATMLLAPKVRLSLFRRVQGAKIGERGLLVQRQTPPPANPNNQCDGEWRRIPIIK